MARRDRPSWMYTDAAWYTSDVEPVDSNAAHSRMTMDDEDGGAPVRAEKASLGVDAAAVGSLEEVVEAEDGSGAENAGCRPVDLRAVVESDERRRDGDVGTETKEGEDSCVREWPLCAAGGAVSSSVWYDCTLPSSSLYSIAAACTGDRWKCGVEYSRVASRSVH